MRLGGCRVEYQAGILVDFGAAQAVQPLMGGEYSKALRPRQSVRLRVNADHGPHLERLAVAHDLDHQIGSDISRSDDRHLQLLYFSRPSKAGNKFLQVDDICQPKRTRTVPISEILASYSSSFCAPTIGPSAPVSTTSPARSGSPASASFLTSHSAAFKG
jgi:hypothetical protein